MHLNGPFANEKFLPILIPLLLSKYKSNASWSCWLGTPSCPSWSWCCLYPDIPLQPPGLSFTLTLVFASDWEWGLGAHKCVVCWNPNLCHVLFALLFVALWPRHWDTSEEVQEGPLLVYLFTRDRRSPPKEVGSALSRRSALQKVSVSPGDIQRTKSFHCIPLILPWCDFLPKIITQGSSAWSWSPFPCSASFSSWMKIWGALFPLHSSPNPLGRTPIPGNAA